MDPFAFTTVGLLILGFAVISSLLKGGFVTAQMLFLTLGWLLAPQICGVIHLTTDAPIVVGLAELTLLLVLFIDAAHIDLAALRREASIPARLLGIGLPSMIILGTAAAYLLFDNFSFWEAALVSAMLAPTDAALGEVVVDDKRVPKRVRQALNVESGLNDGLAFPAVLIFLGLASAAQTLHGSEHWVPFIVRQVGIGVAGGLLFGWVGSTVVGWANKRSWVLPSCEQLSLVGIAILAFAGTEMLTGNGFVAAYIAGLVVGAREPILCRCIFRFGESQVQIFELFTFLLFGATLVWQASLFFSWQALAYALLSLTVIRLASIALSLWGSGLHAKTVLFIGWFGPRGLASILFALIILPKSDLPARTDIVVVVTLTVLLSTFLHGLSARPGVNWFSRHSKALKKERPGCPELG